MSIKIAGKQGKYGIIRHNKTNSAATAYKAIGSTDNQWTNPVLAATNFRRILLTALTPMIESGVTVDEYNTTSQAGLNKESSNFFIDSNSGLAKFNFSAIADRNTLLPLLVAAMQGVTSSLGGGTAYLNYLVSGFLAGAVDFNQGGGFTFGVCEKIGASADDGVLLQNGVIDSITLTFDFNAKGVGRLVGVSGTMAFKSVAYDQTLTGTFVDTTLTPFNNAELFSLSTFTSDAVDLSSICVRRIEVTIQNSVTSNCATTGGAPNQYDFNPEYLINVIVDHNTLTEKLRNDFKNGATVDFTLESSISSDADGYMAIDAPVCKMIGEPMVYNGDFYGYNLPLRAYQSGSTSPLSIQINSDLVWDFNPTT